MSSVSEEASGEAWLRWFQASRYASCRATLCATYGLEPADAEALMNTASLQVVSHWDTLQSPLAYFWTTLRREVQKHRCALMKERRCQEAYALERQFQAKIEESTVHQVADILEQASPRQRQLLWWFVQGYEDTHVATQLGTTPHAVRQARYATYVALRQQGMH